LLADELDKTRRALDARRVRHSGEDEAVE